MRFLFNTLFYKPALGGGGPIYSVSALAEELVRSGHQVTVVATNRDIPGKLDVATDRDHELEGVCVRFFEAKRTLLQRTGLPMFTRSAAFEFGSEFHTWLDANACQFDVFDSQIAFTWSNGPCSRAAVRHDRLYVYHQRANLDPIRLRHGALKKYLYIFLVERAIMLRADVLIALTPHEISTYRRLALPNQIEVIPNGIHAGEPERDLRPTRETTQFLERVGSDLLFCWMSRIHNSKGCDIFVEAFVQCAQEFASVHAVMAGPDEEKLIGQLLAKVGAARLLERFHYLGILAHDDKAAVLKRSDCFVLPTLSEGMSMALLEALAAGCAVITTPGAYFDVIAKSGAGIIVDRSVDAIAKSMNRVCSMGRRQLAEMGERGRRLVQESYSWPSIARRYVDVCQRLKRRRSAHS